MNRTTRAQRINARYEKIWAEAARLQTETRFNMSSRTEERPCAAAGLTSYRYKGGYGFVMIGAKDHSDALRESQRSVSQPVHMKNLEVWTDQGYVKVQP